MVVSMRRDRLSMHTFIQEGRVSARELTRSAVGLSCHRRRSRSRSRHSRSTMRWGRVIVRMRMGVSVVVVRMLMQRMIMIMMIMRECVITVIVGMITAGMRRVALLMLWLLLWRRIHDSGWCGSFTQTTASVIATGGRA